MVILAELMTLEEVADYLRVTTKTIYRLLQRKGIPATKVGHQWRFERASVDAWLRGGSMKTANILVIDDDRAIGAFFTDTLEDAGHKVTAITSPIQALELVKEKDYDLVFLDLKMPEMDGPELFRRIKEYKPTLPVTVITGYPDSDLMMNALAHGPLGIISKPFSSGDILIAVDNYLRFGLVNKRPNPDKLEIRNPNIEIRNKF